MTEQGRRATNRDRVLAYLQAHGAAANHELVQVGGLRAMGRVHELRRDHDIAVEHVQGGLWRVIYRGPRQAGQGELFANG